MKITWDNGCERVLWTELLYILWGAILMSRNKASWGLECRPTMESRVSTSCPHCNVPPPLAIPMRPSRLHDYIPQHFSSVEDEYSHLLLRSFPSFLDHMGSRRSCRVLMWSHLLAAGDWPKVGIWPKTGQSESFPRIFPPQIFQTKTKKVGQDF